MKYRTKIISTIFGILLSLISAHSYPQNTAIPTGISASDGASSNYVTVRWNNVSGATSYDITRCTTTAVTSCSATARGKTGTSYNAGSGAAGTTYYYRVRACNSNGCSAYSSYDTGYKGNNNQLSDNSDYSGLWVTSSGALASININEDNSISLLIADRDTLGLDIWELVTGILIGNSAYVDTLVGRAEATYYIEFTSSITAKATLISCLAEFGYTCRYRNGTVFTASKIN